MKRTKLRQAFNLFVVFIFANLLIAAWHYHTYGFKRNCSWYLFAGDSNMRDIVHQLVVIYASKNYVQTPQETRDVPSGEHVNIGCMWLDQDIVMTHPQEGCVLLSMRFMRCAAMVTRVLDWEQSKTCKNGNVMNSSPPMIAGPHPDLIVFAHGLWSGGGKGAAKDFNCTTFVAPVKSVFDQLSFRNISSVWQTNFEITHHHGITNEYLRAERDCQLSTARERNIKIMNLWTPYFSRKVDSTGFHLNQPALYLVAQRYLTLGVEARRSRDSNLEVTYLNTGKVLSSLWKSGQNFSSYCNK